MGQLTFQPLIPASLWLLMAVVAAVLLAWYGLSRPGRIAGRIWVGVLLLMAGGIAVVLLVLLNPTWIDPIEPPAGKPLLTVLVDESASMAVSDAGDGQSRFEVGRRLAESLGNDLRGRFELRIRSFASGLTPADAGGLASRRPQGVLTDVAAAVAGSVEQTRSAGQAMVLLSDGIHNASAGSREVLDAVRAARAAGAPIFTHTIGRSDTPDIYDLEAEIRSPHQLAYVGQKVPVTVRIGQRGGPGGEVEVSLLSEGQVIETQEVTLPPKGPAETKFMVSRDTPGVYRYEARVKPRPGELIGANNTAVEFLHVVNEPIGVLLLEGKPYWDSKFLMRTLAADPVITLDSLVRMTESRYLRRTLRVGRGIAASAPEASAPAADDGRQERWKVVGGAGELLADAAALKPYQIVVLGRDTEVFLTDAAVNNLRQWMSRQGGSLVCYRGSPAGRPGEKLAQVLPVQWSEASESRFHVRLTEEGRSLRWLGDLDDRLSGDVLSQMPTLATVSRVERPRPLATVLATAGAAGGGGEWPVVTCQSYGTGRVVVIEGAGMWRWAFLPPQEHEYGEVYGALWQSLMRWLVSGTALRPGQSMDLRCEKVLFEASDPASATLLMSAEAVGGGPPPTVELRVAGEENAIGDYAATAAGSDPGVFRVVFGKLPPGQYEALVAGGGATAPSTRFDVRAPVREQLELAVRADLMAKIADDSGGAGLESGTGREVAGLYEAFARRAQPERVRRIPAWDRWYVLVGVLGIWAVCWGVRRAGGLI